jgi:hypothetical protein
MVGNLMKDSTVFLILAAAVVGYLVWQNMGSPTYSQNLITNVLPTLRPGSVAQTASGGLF